MTIATPAEGIDHRDGGMGSGGTARGVSRALAVRLARLDPRFAAVGAAAVALMVAVSAIGNWPVGVFQDDGIYVILAKALATGEGYRYLNLPGAPNATHYPPGYPLFLAGLWKLSPGFPQNVAVFIFANTAFLAAAAAGACLLAHRRLGLSVSASAATAVATVACVPALIFGVFALSEPMFMALLFPTLALAERAAESGARRDALAAGVAAGALAMVRTTGQFVIPALVLVLMLRRRWLPAALAGTGGALFIVPWQLWVRAHGDAVPSVLLGKYGPYSQWLTDAIRDGGLPFVTAVAAKNARALFGMAWTMFAGVDPAGPPPALALRTAIAVLVLGLLAIGIARVARRAPVTLGFLAAYMALVAIWPFEPTRFVWALLPLLGALGTVGVATAARWRPAARPPRALRAAVLVGSSALLVGYAIYNMRGVRERWWASIPDQNAARATPLVEWVRAYTTPDAVLATDDDALLYLYTERRSVPVGTFTAEEYLREQTYDFATARLGEIVAHYHPHFVLGSTSYGVIAAANLTRGSSPQLRMLGALRRGAVFAPVAE
jgi:hypothetical protein